MQTPHFLDDWPELVTKGIAKEYKGIRENNNDHRPQGGVQLCPLKNWLRGYVEWDGDKSGSHLQLICHLPEFGATHSCDRETSVLHEENLC